MDSNALFINQQATKCTGSQAQILKKFFCTGIILVFVNTKTLDQFVAGFNQKPEGHRRRKGNERNGNQIQQLLGIWSLKLLSNFQ